MLRNAHNVYNLTAPEEVVEFDMFDICGEINEPVEMTPMELAEIGELMDIEDAMFADILANEPQL